MITQQLVVSVAVLAAVPAAVCVAQHGPEWEEPCDAGNLPANAEPVQGPPGPVTTIRGRLGRCGGAPGGASGGASGGDFQDMFRIAITSPATFSARVVAGGTTFDTQLWLFDVDGRGKLANDDDPAQPPFSGFGNMSNDGTNVIIRNRGEYFLAISGFNSDPFATGLPIFDQVTRTEISGPDGPGGSLPITGWDSDGEQGRYEIRLTGVSFFPCLGDVDSDGDVDFADLLLVLAAWGPCAGCPEDLDNDDDVDFNDLLILLANWNCGV